MAPIRRKARSKKANRSVYEFTETGSYLDNGQLSATEKSSETLRFRETIRVVMQRQWAAIITHQFLGPWPLRMFWTTDDAPTITVVTPDPNHWQKSPGMNPDYYWLKYSSLRSRISQLAVEWDVNLVYVHIYIYFICSYICYIELTYLNEMDKHIFVIHKNMLIYW